MEPELCFLATSREVVGQKSIYWWVDDDATVGDVLRLLEVEYDSLIGRLIEDGEVKPHVNVLKNGREVVHLDRMAAALDNGGVASVLPPVAGG